ncbi:MAG: hydroxysqualene dehydroxylase HpnE [Planctomycetota bacterium]|nr:FAD-dependent oxidoreductase [Planctomycetaceae bacterium]MDQ3332585.1 hydroxysqualene dehydroxylase HpnE [Planctomycetota bacterium]
MPKRVVIVGGGLAGLAAAESLSARGFHVTLLESRPRLGGRASSFEDKTSGTLIDNCQHVSLGCCTNFRHFCERTGLASSFRVERELNFIGTDGIVNRLKSTSLPAPLHLAQAFNRLSYLDSRDRVALARGLSALAKTDPSKLNGETFDVWLARHHQTENTVNRFWHVVLVSALSESLDRIAVAQARKVFVDAFLAHRDGWTVQIPNAPLDELYGSPLVAHLERQGVVIRTGAGVRRLVADGDRVIAAELRNGESIEGDEFVLAVPHYLAASLLPGNVADSSAVQDLERLETAPISSVHLWFDRSITDLPHAVLIDRLSQWMFNRTMLQAAIGRKDPRHYYQIVISASRELDGTPTADTIAAVHEELCEIWPDARAATLLHSRLVTEHRAVFSVTPGSDRFRPRQQSPIANLQFAGDWTQTGWPATMEGAVRSGYLAAENVLTRDGRAEALVQPDLKRARLARWLLGLS